jgi:ATP-dependent RNA helicase RhlE
MPSPILHPVVQRNLEQMGYARPRPIQDAVREPILLGRDIIGLAQTGTGKTAAFAAPVLHHLISHKPVTPRKRSILPEQRLRALVLCPTRELAQQVQRESGRIAQGSVLRTACVFGKAAITPQAEAIARGVDLLVGTPGRVIELLDDGLLSLAHVRHVVIDEGDRMMDMGFLPQVRRILERVGGSLDLGEAGVAQAGGRKPQIMLFSATMPPAMEDLARTFLREPARIEVGRHTMPVSHVRQHLVPVADEHKVEALLHLLGAASRAGLRPAASAAHAPLATSRKGQALPYGRIRKGVLIFCRTRRRVGWVGTALERHGVKAGMIHGDRSQAQRQRALERFKSGELHVLVATDVASRGLHIPAVKTVVNYDLPLAVEEYVHRVGRAAHGVDEAISSERADATPPQHAERPNEPSVMGEAFTLLDPGDRLHWRAIVDATAIEVYAEHELEGWSPPESAAKKRRGEPDRERTGSAESAEVGTNRQKPARTRRSKGRSRASAPIKKGQKPGRGVRHLGA